jgi:ABC-type glycerol-3-phosphate transport system substrate-binding protein
MKLSLGIVVKTIRPTILAILVAVALLAACNPSSDRESEPGDFPIVTLTFADHGYLEKQYEVLIEEFHAQQTSIRVQFIPLEMESGHQRLASLADVVVFPVRPAGSDVYNYRDLEPLRIADPSFDPTAFWPGSLEGCQVEGRVNGLPLGVQPFLVFYDRAAFEAAGLRRPAPGWSWGDFESAARLLTQHDGEKTVRYGFVGQPLWLLGAVLDAGLSPSSGEFDAAGLARALDGYVSLAQAGAAPVFSQQDGATGAVDLIAGGQAAMWLGLPASMAEWGQEVGVAPWPTAHDGRLTHTTLAGAVCAGISAGSAYPQEAWTWLQFLTTRPRPAIAREQFVLPARTTVAEASEFWEDLDAETVSVLRYALEHAWYGSISSDSFRAIGAALELAIAGEASLVESLASLQVDRTVSPPPTPVATMAPIATPEIAATAAVPRIPPDGAQLVRYFAYSGHHTSLETLQALADAFMDDHPDIFIQLVDERQAFGMHEWYNKEKVAQRFDCFIYGSGIYGDLPALLFSLDPFIESGSDGNELMADLPPDQLAINRFEGELYALPVSAQPTVLYYNMDLFSELGLQPPGLEWTLQDFWTLAEAATTKDSYGFVPLDGREFVNFLLSDQGIELYDLTPVRPVVNFTDAKVLYVFSMLIEKANEGVIPVIIIDSVNNTGNRARLIQTGRAAMWMNSAGMDYGFYTDPSGPSFEVGVAPLPLSRTPGAPMYRTTSLYISRQAEEPAACWEWIKFLSAHPEAFRGVPLRRSALESAQLETLIGRDLAAVYRAVIAQPRQELRLEYTERYPSYPLYLWWPEALTAAFKGKPPEQALADLQAQAQVYMDCVMLQEDPFDTEAWVACAQRADPGFKLPRDN